MKSTDYVIRELENLLTSFPNIKVRYEYNGLANIHTVEVVPNDIFYSNNDYMNWERKVIDAFIRKYPTENVCFISDDALVGIERPSYEKQGRYYDEDVKQIISI